MNCPNCKQDLRFCSCTAAMMRDALKQPRGHAIPYTVLRVVSVIFLLFCMGHGCIVALLHDMNSEQGAIQICLALIGLILVDIAFSVARGAGRE